MAATRFSISAAAALSIAFGVWFGIAMAHPVFRAYAASGLVAPVLAGLIGGFIAGRMAPHHKVVFSALLGAVLAGVLLTLMLLMHAQAAGRNPFLWYWPAWLAPCFLVGGILSRKPWGRA